MPVGTNGTVKALELKILRNRFRNYSREYFSSDVKTGDELIKDAGPA